MSDTPEYDDAPNAAVSKAAEPNAADSNADVATLTYEQARDALAETVAKLEQGATSLEDSIALWERGNALAARCDSWLAGAREKITAADAGDGTAAGETA